MHRKEINKKLQQIEEKLAILEKLLANPFAVFRKDIVMIMASERCFERVVEIADDINAHLLTEKTGKTPDTYAQAFLAMANADILESALAKKLVDSVKIRNILVHEYDFEEDYEKFYHSAASCIPSYREYGKQIHAYVQKNL